MSDTVGLLAMLVPGTLLVGGILGWARRGSHGPKAHDSASEPGLRSADQAPSPARWLPIFLFGAGALMVLLLAVLVARPLDPASASGLIEVIGPGFVGLMWLASRGFLK